MVRDTFFRDIVGFGERMNHGRATPASVRSPTETAASAAAGGVGAANNESAKGGPQAGEIRSGVFLEQDVADWFPLEHPARLKLLRLRQLRDDAHALIRPLDDQLRDQIQRRLEAERNKQRFSEARTRGRSAFGEEPEADAGEVTQDKRIASATAEIKRLRALIEERKPQWSEAGQIVDGAENYIRQIGAARVMVSSLGSATGVVLKKGETHHAAVDRNRRRLRELASDLEAIRAAPIPVGDAKRLARAEIERLAEVGRPNCLGVVDRGGKLEWPSARLTGVSVSVPAPSVNGPDTLAIFAWMFKDQLCERLDGLIEEAADDKNALSDGQRAARAAEVRADRLAVEREEESLITDAAAQGVAIARRGDADPRAVLSLADHLPEPE